MTGHRHSNIYKICTELSTECCFDFATAKIGAGWEGDEWKRKDFSAAFDC